MRIFVNSIAFISPFAYPLVSGNFTAGCGGAERQLFLFGRKLSDRGWQVSFITDIPDNGVASRSTIFPVYYANFSHLKGSNIWLLRDILSLWRAMKQANTYYYVLKVPGYLLSPMSVFCALYGRKLVFWASMNYNANPREMLEINRIAGVLQNWGLRKASIVLAQSEDQRKGFKDNFGLNAIVVPNICDSLVPVDSPGRSFYFQKKEVDVLWVGNSLPKKRQEVFFELAKLLPHRTFAIAINNSNELRFNLAREKAKNLHNVTFLGTVAPIEMESWFRKTKIFLNTSLLEGFPNTYLQAWINGVPVVSLTIDPDGSIKRYNLGDVVGCDQVAKCHGDLRSMAKMLVPLVENLLRDTKRRTLLGKNARDFVIAYHSSSVVLPRLIDALGRSVIGVD